MKDSPLDLQARKLLVFREPITIGERRICLSAELGRGASSIVYRGWDEGQNKRVVIKEFNPKEMASFSRTRDNKFIPKGEQQSQLACKLLDEFTGGYRSWCEYMKDSFFFTMDPQLIEDSDSEGISAYIITTEMNGCDLASVNGSGKEPKLYSNYNELIQITNAVINRILPIHSNGKLYLDLKPENIFLFDKSLRKHESRSASLFDFDSVVTLEHAKAHSFKTTHKYAPSKEPPSKQYDVYTVGGVLLWLVTGASPGDYHCLLPHLSEGKLDSYSSWSLPISNSDPCYLRILEVLRRSLSCDLNYRYQTLNDMQDALFQNLDTPSPEPQPELAQTKAFQKEYEEQIEAFYRKLIGNHADLKDDLNKGFAETNQLIGEVGDKVIDKVDEVGNTVKETKQVVTKLVSMAEHVIGAAEKINQNTGGKQKTQRHKKKARGADPTTNTTSKDTPGVSAGAKEYAKELITRKEFLIGAAALATTVAAGGLKSSIARNIDGIPIYFSNVCEKWGVATGIGEPLSEYQRNSLPEYWEIKDRPWQNQLEMSFITGFPSFDIINENSARYQLFPFLPVAKIQYDYVIEKGTKKATSCTYYDSNGAVAASLDYSTDSTDSLMQLKVYKGAPNLFGSTFFKGHGPVGLSTVRRGGFVRSYEFRLSHDDEGRVVNRRLTVEMLSSGITGSYNLIEEVITYNSESGDVSEVELIGKRDEGSDTPKGNSLGIAKTIIEPSETGRTIEYLGEDGRLAATGLNGAAREVHQLYSGCITEVKFEYSEGKLCSDTNGVSLYEFHLSDGQFLRESYYKSRGQRMFSQKLNAFAREYRLEDPRALIVLHNRKGSLSHDEIQIISDNIISDRASRDIGLGPTEHSLRLEGATNLREEVIGSATPAVGCRYNFGKSGALKSEMHLAVDEEPTINKEGFAICEYSYNPDNLIKTIQYKDAHNESMYSKNGHAKTEYYYDKDWQVEQIHFFDEGGKATFSKVDRCAVIEYEREVNDGLLYVWERYYEADGTTRAYNTAGFAGALCVYESLGRLNARHTINSDDKLCYDIRTGYSSITYEYNSLGGEESSRALFGPSGEEGKSRKVMSKNGFHKRERVVKENEEWYHYKDINGDLCLTENEGFATVHFCYDDNGRVVEEEYLGKNKESIPHKVFGFARRMTLYEDNKKVVTHHGANQEDVVDLIQGFHKMEETRQDVDGSTDYQHWFRYYGPPDNTGVARPIKIKSIGAAVVCDTYDELGRWVSQHLYEEDGETGVVGNEGFAYKEYEYDDYGNIEWVRYYGFGASDKNPTLATYGHYAARHQIFDSTGSFIADRYYGIKDDPTIVSYLGYSGYEVSDFDNRGNPSTVEFFDTGGAVGKVHQWGYAIKRYEYDNYDRETKETFFEKDGHTRCCVRQQGYSGILRSYNEANLLEWTHFLDDDDVPTPLFSGGYTSEQLIYNERGLIVEKSYHVLKNAKFENNRDTRVCRKDTGYAVVELQYNEELYPDRLSCERYLDENRLPIVCIPECVYETKWEYDPRGNEELLSFLGSYGLNPSSSVFNVGVSTYSRKFDSLDRLTEESYLDGNENLVATRANFYLDHRLEARAESGYYKCAMDHSDFDSEYAFSSKKISTLYKSIDGKEVEVVITETDDIDGQQLTASIENSTNYESRSLVLIKREHKKPTEERPEHHTTTVTRYGFLPDSDAKELMAKTREEKSYPFPAIHIYQSGKLESIWNLDESNTETISSDGYSGKQRYVEHQPELIIEDIFYYGTDKDYIDLPNSSHSCERRKYDIYGNLLGKYYYTLNEQRTEFTLVNRSDLGYSYVEYTYDTFGRELTAQYSNYKHGSAFNADLGCTGYTYEYFDDEQMISYRLLGANGDEIIGNEGYAIRENYFDEFGYLVESRYFDEGHVPLLITSKVDEEDISYTSVHHYTYDSWRTWTTVYKNDKKTIKTIHA